MLCSLLRNATIVKMKMGGRDEEKVAKGLQRLDPREHRSSPTAELFLQGLTCFLLSPVLLQLPVAHQLAAVAAVLSLQLALPDHWLQSTLRGFHFVLLLRAVLSPLLVWLLWLLWPHSCQLWASLQLNQQMDLGLLLVDLLSQLPVQMLISVMTFVRLSRERQWGS